MAASDPRTDISDCKTILALNAGSSSLKFALYAARQDMEMLARGELEIHGDDATFTARDAGGRALATPDVGTDNDLSAAIDILIGWVESFIDRPLDAVGHRVVHGGPDFSGPVILSAETLAALEGLTPLAPLHQPTSLAPVRELAARCPGLLQVACFDTAFHTSMPEDARMLPLPAALTNDGKLRRYGFHGLSYAHIAHRLVDLSPRLANGRTIVAHLGSGASLCALKSGRSIETTMGFSALDGLLMGTRCGQLDPGVLLYLSQAKGMDHDRIETLLYHESGLLGVSGRSADMRDLLKHRDDPAVTRALSLYLYRLKLEIGGLIAALGGADGLIFTAGIGENTPWVRERVCADLAWLGLRLDPDANTRNAPLISTPDSTVEVRIEPADEEIVIARSVRHLITRH